MKKVPSLFVANWKMAKTFNESQQFWHTAALELVALAEHDIRIIVAPTYLAITQAVSSAGRAIAVAAQDCSSHARGAYTGQVDAASLAQAGCKYVILGHSERRQEGDTNETIQAKLTQALSAGLIPILCVGESALDNDSSGTIEALKEQLVVLNQVAGAWQQVIIAYEPQWAIGAGVTPSADHLVTIAKEITRFASHHGSSQSVLLYGGSIDEHSCQPIASLGLFDGFLVGSASLDFKKFQNIVSLSRMLKK